MSARCGTVVLSRGKPPLAAGLPKIVFAGSGAPLPESFAAWPTWVAHFWLATLLVGFIVLHLGAALHHQLVQRDGLLRRMGFGSRALRRELINPQALADFRSGAHHGLKSDIARGPKSAKSGSKYGRDLADRSIRESSVGSRVCNWNDSAEPNT